MYFSEKTTAKAAARLFPNPCASFPASTNGKDTPSTIRLPVFVGNERHFSHNGPETLGNRGVIFRRETRKISVTGLDQAHFEQIQGHYARTREPGQMFGKRCFTRMRGTLKEKNHLKKKEETTERSD